MAIRFIVARLPRAKAPLLRLALANLHRPGAQTDRLVVALGLGFSLFVALAMIDSSPSAELAGAAPTKVPRFFAIDLQPEDAPAFRAAIDATAPGARIEAAPSLRGATTGIKGARLADMKALPDAAWVLRGDRTLTWSADMPPRNEVVAGNGGQPIIGVRRWFKYLRSFGQSSSGTIFFRWPKFGKSPSRPRGSALVTHIPIATKSDR